MSPSDYGTLGMSVFIVNHKSSKQPSEVCAEHNHDKMVSVRENGRNTVLIGLARFRPLNISGGISVHPSDYGTLVLAVLGR